MKKPKIRILSMILWSRAGGSLESATSLVSSVPPVLAVATHGPITQIQIIVMLGAMAHMTGHFMYAHAQSDTTMYVGATAAALGPCVAPLIRSMTSKVLEPAERGVAYTFLSVMENAVAMFASVIYAQLYNATINTPYINAIFYLTMSTQAVVFLLAMTMELMLKGRRLESTVDQEERNISEASS